LSYAYPYGFTVMLPLSSTINTSTCQEKNKMFIGMSINIEWDNNEIIRAIIDYSLNSYELIAKTLSTLQSRKLMTMIFSYLYVNTQWDEESIINDSFSLRQNLSLMFAWLSHWMNSGIDGIYAIYFSHATSFIYWK
jgi:hypothetical protein